MTQTKDKKTIKGVIVKKEFTELKRIGTSYSDEQKAFIRKTLAPTLDDNELLLFLYRAKKLGLNPLQGEITAHSRDTKHGRRLVVIIGKDGKARKAMQTGLVEYARVEAIYIKTKMGGDPSKDTKPTDEVIRCQPWEGGTLWGAKAEVKRKNVAMPFEVVLPVSEYSSGELTKFLPSTMIKKTALSQAYTMAFPDLFAGVYVEGEVSEEPRQKKPLTIDGGNRPATEAQMATIKALKGAIQVNATKQEAADVIKDLAKKKGKNG